MGLYRKVKNFSGKNFVLKSVWHRKVLWIELLYLRKENQG